MANIFLSQTISYISIQEVKDSTSKPAIALLSNDAVKILIVKAEKAINDYVGYSIDVSEVDAETIQDWKMATLYVVEQIYENADMIATQTDKVQSESTGDRSVTYATDSSKQTVLGIPQNSIDLLVAYRKNFYRQVI